MSTRRRSTLLLGSNLSRWRYMGRGRGVRPYGGETLSVEADMFRLRIVSLSKPGTTRAGQPTSHVSGTRTKLKHSRGNRTSIPFINAEIALIAI